MDSLGSVGVGGVLTMRGVDDSRFGGVRGGLVSSDGSPAEVRLSDTGTIITSGGCRAGWPKGVVSAVVDAAMCWSDLLAACERDESWEVNDGTDCESRCVACTTGEDVVK